MVGPDHFERFMMVMFSLICFSGGLLVIALGVKLISMAIRGSYS